MQRVLASACAARNAALGSKTQRVGSLCEKNDCEDVTAGVLLTNLLNFVARRVWRPCVSHLDCLEYFMVTIRPVA